MMRSPNNIVVAVRKPDGGIKVKKKHYKALTQRYKILNIPVIRGIINLFEMMGIGAKAINWSANISMEEPENPKTAQLPKTLEILMFIFSFVLAIGLALFLFKFIPLWITTFFESRSSYIEQNYIVFNIIDGVIKTTIFIGYIFILSVIPSFRRVFEYHGAEHKAIFAYEKKRELTVQNARPQPRFHPRCGTSFILIVFLVSILVYTFIPKQPDFWANLGLRLAFLPLIAGISYEYLKLSAKYTDKIFVKALVAPGLWLQHITTKPPDDKQLEVSLKALSQALKMEK